MWFKWFCLLQEFSSLIPIFYLILTTDTKRLWTSEKFNQGPQCFSMGIEGFSLSSTHTPGKPQSKKAPLSMWSGHSYISVFCWPRSAQELFSIHLFANAWDPPQTPGINYL